MVSVRHIPKPEGELPCSVPKCKDEAFGALIFLNIAFEYVVLQTCGEHNQLLQSSQIGVVELLRFEELIDFSKMTKKEIIAYKAKHGETPIE